MSLHLDYAEISRQASEFWSSDVHADSKGKIVDANRARTVMQQQQAEPSEDPNVPRKKVKFSRSTKGCLPCRSHKVKCDETTPTCLRCVASQRVCEYPPPRQSTDKKRGQNRKRSESQSQDQHDTVENEDHHDNVAGGPSNDPGSSGSSFTHTPTMSSFMAGVGHGGNGMGGPSGSSGSTSAVNGHGQQEFPLNLPRMKQESPSQISPSEMFNITPNAHPNNVPAPTALTPANGQTFSSPDLSFLNDLIPDFNVTELSPASNPFFPNTSPTSTLPVNWGPPASQPQPALTMPQIANLAKSTLLNRRVGKGKEPGNADHGSLQGTPVPSIPSRLTVIDSIIHAFAFDDTLFEFGPSHRQRALSTAGLQTSTDVLSNAFPSPIARTLFHHYCNVTSRILVTMGNIGPNPLLAICTPLRLLETNTAASAAMRMSMLSTSVAHFAHETEQHLGDQHLPPGWAGRKGQLKAMSHKFKKAALSNILLSAGGSNDMGTAQTDDLLAACTLLCIRDVIAADPTWRDNMDFVLNLISKKGGPQAMLKPSEYSFTRRYLLENLAAHDVFSYFTTGKEPQLLGNYDSWWFDSVETSTTRWEWESVERSFGISRAMVDLVARICVLDSHKRRLGISLKGHPDELWDAGQHFIRESHCLLLELDIWGNSLNALPQHFRVTCGDYIYKYMAVIYTLGEILEQDVNTPRIISAVNHVLELCSEADAFRLNVMLIWPLLIAGMFCLEETRPKVRSLFDAFSADYTEELVVARELLEEQWRGIDTGLGRRRWTEVMKHLDKPVLLI